MQRLRSCRVGYCRQLLDDIKAAVGVGDVTDKKSDAASKTLGQFGSACMSLHEHGIRFGAADLFGSIAAVMARRGGARSRGDCWHRRHVLAGATWQGGERQTIFVVKLQAKSVMAVNELARDEQLAHMFESDCCHS